MAVYEQYPTGALDAVIAHMAAEYAGVVPTPLVVAVVRDAERDLRGQVVPAALGEMLHRLAAFRLHEITQDRPGSGRGPATAPTVTGAHA
jgi:hypothetical protein